MLMTKKYFLFFFAKLFLEKLIKNFEHIFVWDKFW